MATLPNAYFPGAPGSSGGLTRNPYGPQQYGYGQGPGQTNLGYYEQQTPMGSFAAADRTQMPQQQYAQAYGASNPYIGQTSQGVGSQASVLPYAQQIAAQGQQANPYLGQQTQQVGSAGQNQYMGRNPYLQQQVQSGLQQSADSFRDTVMPSFDRMSQASGSFGNTGVEAARGRAMDAFGRSQANAATNAYMQDYATTQGLAENALNRNQAVNMANAGFSNADLSRNLAGAFQGQQLGMQGLGSLLNAGQFDANLGQQGGMFNASLADTGLGRNQGLASQLGMFNAGQQGNASQFNASQGNQLGQYGAGLNQQTNLYNAGAGNAFLENTRNRDQQQGQFDASLDWNIDQGNWNRQRTGQQDQISLIDNLLRWGQSGIGNATQMQNAPLQYLQQFMNIGNTAGQNGGSNTASQQYQGNQVMAALGAWLASQGLNFGG